MALIWKNKMDTISCGLPFCLTSSDILRIPEKCRKCRYANISQLFQRFKSADMLEQPCLSSQIIY